MKGFLISANIVIMMLGACGPASPPPGSPSAVSTTGSDNATTQPPAALVSMLKKASNNEPPFDKLPPPPIQGSCFETGQAQNDCYFRQSEVLREWPLAWAGDYQAQRNIAYALSNPKPGVAGDETQGCAWRIVLTLSGHPQYNGSLDEPNYDLECGRLSLTNWAAAKAGAGTTFKRITGKALPPVPEPTRRP